MMGCFHFEPLLLWRRCYYSIDYTLHNNCWMHLYPFLLSNSFPLNLHNCVPVAVDYWPIQFNKYSIVYMIVNSVWRYHLSAHCSPDYACLLHTNDFHSFQNYHASSTFSLHFGCIHFWTKMIVKNRNNFDLSIWWIRYCQF